MNIMQLQAKTIRLRLVTEDDAEFILSLRKDERYNKFLSTVSSDLTAQIEWIRKYKIEEKNNEQFYFIIEKLDGSPCGTIRVYDLKEDSFCWGSWILNENKTRYSALESAFLVYDFGFNFLGFSNSHFDVMKENKKVIAFHENMGAITTGEDENNKYFTINKDSVFLAKKNLNVDILSELNGVNSFKINDIKVGMLYSCTHVITKEDVIKFAEVSSDYNPLHLDEEYAKNTRFKRCIAHGMLSAGFFSAIIGTKFPGIGSIYISQSLEFKRPVYIDDTVAASVVVVSVDATKKRVTLHTLCYVLGKQVTKGVAEVLIP